MIHLRKYFTLINYTQLLTLVWHRTMHHTCVLVSHPNCFEPPMTMLGVMQLRVRTIEFILKYLPVITGKTCATVVNMKALFASSLRYLPLAQMKRTLDGKLFSQLEYIDNNSTVSNIVCTLLSTIFITLDSLMPSQCDLHDGNLLCGLSLLYSRLCPRARPLTAMFTIGSSWASSHCDIHENIFVRDLLL